MKTLTVLWGLLIAGGLVFMNLKTAKHPASATPCGYKATRHLPVSYRLQDGDWSNPQSDAASITGQYADRDYAKNKTMCAADLLASPRIVAGSANPVVLNVAAGPLNAGAVVDVWRNKKIAAQNVPVLAVLCGAKDCPYVVVGIRNQDMGPVTDGDAAPVLLIRKLPQE